MAKKCSQLRKGQSESKSNLGQENNNSTQCGLNDTPLTQNNDVYLDFNGRELRWRQNNEVTNSWKAMSGKPDYQCKEYDSVKDKGPLPAITLKNKNYIKFVLTSTLWAF